MINSNATEKRWISYYHLLIEYFETHKNADVPDLYEVDGVMLGSWLSRQKQAYKKDILARDKIQLLNALDVDWSSRDTSFLNREITENNIEKYNDVLLDRLNHILEDMFNEGINGIHDNLSQKEMEKVIIKRLWR